MSEDNKEHRSQAPSAEGEDSAKGPAASSELSSALGFSTLSPEQRARKNRLERWAMVIAALAFSILILVQREIIDLGPGFSDSQGLVALVSINVSVLLTTFLILLILRHLYRIFFETQSYGSLQTKLVVAFVFLSLLPTMLIFYYSYRQLVRGHDLWFSTQIEEALVDSMALTKAIMDIDANLLSNYGSDIYDDYALMPPETSVADVKNFLEQNRLRFHLSTVELYGKEGEMALRAGPPGLPPITPDWFSQQPLKSDDPWSNIASINEGELTRLVWPFLPQGIKENDLVKPTGYLAIGHLIDVPIRYQMENVLQALGGYQDALNVQRPFRVTQLTALTAMAMLAVLISIWIGSHLASSLSRPVLELVEGTRKVAAGDWDFTMVHQEKSGEFAQLVDSFNGMTRNLKRMYSELDSRHRFLEIVLKNVSTGVVVLEKNGQLRHMNQAAIAILDGKKDSGADPGDHLGSHLNGEAQADGNFSRVEDQEMNLPLPLTMMVQEAMDIIQASPTLKRGLERHIRLNVGDISLSLRAGVAPLRNEEGVEMAYLLTFDDLTELENAQRLAAWQEVARRIAHEVKNPLTPIQLAAQRLNRRFSERLAQENDVEVFNECTEVIIRQVEEMKKLVDEFSRFARLPEIKPVVGDFVSFLEDSLMLFRQAHKQIHFNLEIKNKPPFFSFDPEQMRRVFTNILDNAIAAMDQKGSIYLTMETNEMVGLRLTITDTGPGLPEEIKKSLFEPQVTTKVGGQGLGLAIVRTIVNDHGGFIKAKNVMADGQGACFIIELPLRQ